jgi:hypothetical protein
VIGHKNCRAKCLAIMHSVTITTVLTLLRKLLKNDASGNVKEFDWRFGRHKHNGR